MQLTYFKYIDKHFFSALGICLILLGMQTGNFIRSLIGVELVDVLMFLGILSLIDYKNIIKRKLPLFYGLMFLVFLSQLVILIYALLAGGSKNELMNFVFLLYSFAIILAVSSNNEKLFSKFPLVVYFFSSFSVILGLCVLTNGFTGLYLGEDLYYLRKDVEKEGLSMMFLYGSTAIVHIIATCCIYRKIKEISFLWTGIASLLMIVDVILLIVAGKRTVMLASFLVVLYFIWNQKIKISGVLFKLFISIFVLFFVLSAVIDFELVSEVIDGVFESMTSGLGTFFGMEDAVFDESASIRVSLRQWAFNTINEDFTLFNYLFGYGYMTRYLDQPILQCYFDMGIVGVFCYAFIIIILPIRFLVNRKNDVTMLFFKMYSILGIISCLTGGLPYGYRLYMSSIFLFAAHNVQSIIKNKRI